MAIRKLYIGSVGPLLYDDSNSINDGEGYFPGISHQGLVTNGKVIAEDGVAAGSIDLLDSDSSNFLSIKWGENDTSDRTLNLLLSGADRSLTLSGNVALNQSLLSTSSPTFSDLTLTTPTYAMFNLSAPVTSSILQWDATNSVWVWSSGISDLSGFTTDDLTEGLINKYFPGFTDLSTDYNFTDNSSNWDTTYSWGDHASGGYVKADGTVSFTSKVSYNNDKTFSSDTELVSKKYVDDTVSSAGGYTDEMAQDAVGAMADTNSLTYVDATPLLSVKHQMSITSDTSGLKLSGDSAAPGNSKVYGTDASGNKGWQNAGSGSMTYPGAGIALSTGSSWSGSITNNSANWDTAYGWGSHASAGYLSSTSTGITADSWTINSDKANVTSSLIFGRTTGGDGTIAHDGTHFNLNKGLKILYDNSFFGVNNNTRAHLLLYGAGSGVNTGGRITIYPALDYVTNVTYWKLDGIGKNLVITRYGYNDLMIDSVGTIRTGSDMVVSGGIYSYGNLITINVNKTDVTSVLTFGRTTGGDATISWNGTALNINKNIYDAGNVSADSFTARSGQITFPATQVPSTNANTLDDYEEGTFVPTVYCSGGGGYTLNPSYNTLSYVKIGSLITITGRLIINDKDSVSGWVRISIPFACADLAAHAESSSGVAVLGGLTSGNGIGAVSIYAGVTTIFLYNADGIEITKAEAGSSFTLQMTLTFRAAN